MNNEQILKRAIEKAVKNGYVWPYSQEAKSLIDFTGGDHYEIIFSHDFAKAFWGTKKFTEDWGPVTGPTYELWQYHLQQMVLEENPLDYLAKFLD